MFCGSVRGVDLCLGFVEWIVIVPGAGVVGVSGFPIKV